jgi:hypothetical protein
MISTLHQARLPLKVGYFRIIMKQALKSLVLD